MLVAESRNSDEDVTQPNSHKKLKKTMKNNNLCMLRKPVSGALCAAILVFVSANPALAQDWRFEPILRVGGEFEDNATLDPRTDEEVQVSGLLLDLRADVSYSSPTASFLVQPSFLVRNYDDDEVPDAEDLFLRSTFFRRAEASTVGFLVNYDSQSVRNGERLDSDLDIEDPDEIPNDDTGRVLLIGDRERWRVSPYWEYQVSKLSSIGVNFDLFDTQYDDVFAGVLTDFSDVRVGLNYRRSVSSVTAWGISLSGRRFDSDGLPEEVDGLAVLASIEHDLSEKTRISAEIGYEDTKETGFDIDPEIIGNVTLSRNLETIRLFAQYRRSVNGTGAGALSVRDSLNLNFRRRLNEKISAGLGVRAYQTSPVGGSSTIEDRTYVQLQWNLNWYLTRSFVIEADYRYTVIDRGETAGGRANSNQVNLWFVYQPRTVPRI